MISKKNYSIAIIIAGVIFSLNSMATSPVKHQQNKSWYIGAMLGYADLTGFKNNQKLSNASGTANYGVTTGCNINEWLRTGVELSHRHKKNITGDSGKLSFSTTTAFLNGYFKAPNTIPYLVAGVGTSYNYFGNYKSPTSQTPLSKHHNKYNFAYQGGFGLSSEYKQFAFDGDIKYVNKGKATTATEPKVKANIRDIIFSITLRYYL
jgi:hypothetical protein